MKLILTFSFGRGNPEPWRYFSTDVMLNAIDLLTGRNGVRRPRGVRVWVDSGGFQLLNGKMEELTVHEILEAQAKLKPDYAVMPDDPRSPRLSLKRYREALDLAPKLGLRAELVPVVHTTWKREMLHSLCEELDFEVLAVGGVAPGLSRPFRISAAKALIRFIWKLKSIMKREAALHVLGVGGPSLIPALAALGIDSLDTASWIHDARYGVVRVGAKAFTVKVRGRDRLPRLLSYPDCRCPICREGPEALRKTGLEGLRARAVHNAFNLLEMCQVVSRSPRDPASIMSHLESEGMLSRTAKILLEEVEKLEESPSTPMQ